MHWLLHYTFVFFDQMYQLQFCPFDKIAQFMFYILDCYQEKYSHLCANYFKIVHALIVYTDKMSMLLNQVWHT